MSDFFKEEQVVLLTEAQAAAVRRAARALDISESDLIRRALKRFLAPESLNARTSEAEDERCFSLRRPVPAAH